MRNQGKRLAGAGSLLALLVVTAPACWAWPGKSKQAEPPKSHLDEGKSYLEHASEGYESENGQPSKYGYEYAVAEFESAIKETPESWEAHYLLGVTCTDFYFKAPWLGSADAHQRAAPCLSRAADALSKAAQLKPDQPDVRYWLAKNLMARRKEKEAIDQLRQGLTALKGDRERTRQFQARISEDPVLKGVSDRDEYRRMIATVLEADAPVETIALKLYDQAAGMMASGQLKGADVKAGLANFKTLISLLPTQCGEQDASSNCPDIIKYGYQAERDFDKALKRDKTMPNVVRQLHKMAQQLEMDATYALGIDFLNGGGYEVEETRRQFQRLARIDPNFRDVAALLAQPAKWVPIAVYQRDINEASSKLEYYKGALETMGIKPSDIQVNVLNRLAPVAKLPKERVGNDVQSLFQEAQQLLARASKDRPRTRIQLAVDWRAIPPGTGVLIEAGFPIYTTVTDGVSSHQLAFTTEEEAAFEHGAKPAVFSAIYQRDDSDPLDLKLPARPQWKVTDTQGQARIRLKREYAPFENSDAFGKLDAISTKPDDMLWNKVYSYVKATSEP